MGRLFLLFITVPVLEILIYIQLSKLTGIWFTLAVIFGTGVIGAFLAKREGFHVVQVIRQELSMGQMPGNRLIEGLLILVGGVLLLTPGLLTDITGFIMLIPQTRRLLVSILRRKLRKWIDNGQVYFYIKS